MIYSLAKRQPRRGAEAGGRGGVSTAMEIESGNDSGTGDALIPVAVTTYRDRASHRSSDYSSSSSSSSYAIMRLRFFSTVERGTVTKRP